MSRDPQEPSNEYIVSDGKAASGHRKEATLQRLARRFSNQQHSTYQLPTCNTEQRAIQCIDHLMKKKMDDSKPLQDFMSNCFWKRPVLISEEYRAEYKHVFGWQNYDLHTSTLVGAVTFGFLNGLQVGNLATQFISSASVAVLRSYKHACDPQLQAKLFETIPLVSGRSVVSDELCPLIVSQCRRLLRPGYEPENPTLAMYFRFAENCEMRSVVESIERKKRGLPDGTPVSISSPGVEAHYPFAEELCALSFAMSQEDFMTDGTLNAQSQVNKLYKER